MYANFVSSIDGVVALGSSPSAGSIISGRNQADRFLMALLRACADAVLLGAGTLRATPGHLWTPEHVFPGLAEQFAELRRELGRRPEPRLIVFTSGGELDVTHPAIVHGATVVSTSAAAPSLRDRLPDTCDVLEAGEGGRVNVVVAVEQLRTRGFDVLLTEGGPHLVGQLIKTSLLDEVFLTVSPIIAGRDAEDRLGMVAGAEFLPSSGSWSSLLSARRHGDYLFLRYRLATGR